MLMIRAALVFLVVMMMACSSSYHYAPVEGYRSLQQKNNSQRYLVRTGDTLYSIAWQQGLDFRVLANWNGVTPPYTIYPGQTIALTPQKKSTTLPKSIKKPLTNKTKNNEKQRVRQESSKKYEKKLKFSWRWPITPLAVSRDKVKSGVVLRGKSGELVRSSEEGKVVYAGAGLKAYGNLLIVKHNEEFLTAYGYNKKLLVKEGQFVKKGQAIAEIGRDVQQKPSLFFEMRRFGKAVSVTKYLPNIGG